MEKTVAAFGEFKADDRVAGAELLQKDAAKRRRLERAAAAEEAAGAAEEAGGRRATRTPRTTRRWVRTTTPRTPVTATGASSCPTMTMTMTTKMKRMGRMRMGEDDEEEVSVSGSDDDDVDPEEEDEYGRVLDPKTGLKRKYIQPALTLAQKRDMATRAVAEAEARGEAAPKVTQKRNFIPERTQAQSQGGGEDTPRRGGCRG